MPPRSAHSLQLHSKQPALLRTQGKTSSLKSTDRAGVFENSIQDLKTSPLLKGVPATLILLGPLFCRSCPPPNKSAPFQRTAATKVLSTAVLWPSIISFLCSRGAEIDSENANGYSCRLLCCRLFLFPGRRLSAWHRCSSQLNGGCGLHHRRLLGC